jgi:hypothetical protein
MKDKVDYLYEAADLAGPVQEILTERRPSGRGSYCYSPALFYGKRPINSTSGERRTCSAQSNGSGSFLSPSRQESYLLF